MTRALREVHTFWHLPYVLISLSLCLFSPETQYDGLYWPLHYYPLIGVDDPLTQDDFEQQQRLLEEVSDSNRFLLVLTLTSCA